MERRPDWFPSSINFQLEVRLWDHRANRRSCSSTSTDGASSLVICLPSVAPFHIPNMLNSVVNAMLAGSTQHDGTLDSLWICGSLGHLLDQSWMDGWVDGRMGGWQTG